MAYHNLCKITAIPNFIKHYLGLSLKFCPTPCTTSAFYDFDFQRFSDDYCRYIFFRAGDRPDDYSHPPLYVPTDTVPGPIDELYIDQLNLFTLALKKMLIKKSADINLSPSQLPAQTWLLNHPEVTVLNANKNLGPITMDRADYIRHAFFDHLHDSKTYKRLQPYIKDCAIANIRTQIHNFCEIWKERKVCT